VCFVFPKHTDFLKDPFVSLEMKLIP
jgi:hypothetical protein